MKRRWIGFLAGSGIALIVDLVFLTTLGLSSESSTAAWWLINFPSFPLFCCCAIGISPGPGPGDDGGDSVMAVAAVLGSCLTWGGFGFWIGRGREAKPSPASEAPANGPAGPGPG